MLQCNHSVLSTWSPVTQCCGGRRGSWLPGHPPVPVHTGRPLSLAQVISNASYLLFPPLPKPLNGELLPPQHSQALLPKASTSLHFSSPSPPASLLITRHPTGPKGALARGLSRHVWGGLCRQSCTCTPDRLLPGPPWEVKQLEEFTGLRSWLTRRGEEGMGRERKIFN